MLLNKVAKLVTMLPEKPQLAVSNVIVRSLLKKYANIKVVKFEGEFNYSAVNNLGSTLLLMH